MVFILLLFLKESCNNPNPILQKVMIKTIRSYYFYLYLQIHPIFNLQ